MHALIVVNDPADWELDIPGVEMVSAWSYLTCDSYSKMRRLRIYNLCRSYSYQSFGYYVSLLAAARGHKPFPTVKAIQDMESSSIVRLMSSEMDKLIQKNLGYLQSDSFELSIYFGRNLAKRYDRLSAYLYRFFEAPFLRAYFQKVGNRWQLETVTPIAANDIPDDHKEFIAATAKEFFPRQRTLAPRRAARRYDLAILVNRDETLPPSDEKALNRFVKAANGLGLAVEFIGLEDFARLPEFDALFIRETTNVNHHTYRFARKAEAEGLVVVDDSLSILKCSNKVYLNELLESKKLPTPRTIVIHRDNLDVVVEQLTFPVIIKQPDSSFSQGVLKAENIERYHEITSRMLEDSALLIVQEFIPTSFDWRVVVFDGHPLCVCKYYMAARHWQILRKDAKTGRFSAGKAETFAVEHAPRQVVELALKAANLIGDGLYGVDIKQRDKELYVIEVNDNPNIDSGVEDLVLKDELYERIMRVFLKRIERRKEVGY